MSLQEDRTQLNLAIGTGWAIIAHCKCLQGFTGTLRGNPSVGISNLQGLHSGIPAIPVIFEVNKKKCGLFIYCISLNNVRGH